MTLRKTGKTVLVADPGQARAQLEVLASKLAPDQDAAGAQLRAVAVELVRRGLHVTVVDYRDACHELEAILPQAPHLGPVTIDRDASGTGCQPAVHPCPGRPVQRLMESTWSLDQIGVLKAVAVRSRPPTAGVTII